MDKIKAARQGEGLIKLGSDSAEQVKQAIEQVSSITSLEDDLVSFTGHRIVEGHGFALVVNSYDIYDCPDGYLLHTYMDKGPNWAVTGKTLPEMLARAPDQRVAERARGLLVQKGYLGIHQH